MATGGNAVSAQYRAEARNSITSYLIGDFQSAGAASIKQINLALSRITTHSTLLQWAGELNGRREILMTNSTNPNSLLYTEGMYHHLDKLYTEMLQTWKM